jgi:hypothetical protein
MGQNKRSSAVFRLALVGLFVFGNLPGLAFAGGLTTWNLRGTSADSKTIDYGHPPAVLASALAERHDDCVGATDGDLGNVALRNNCREEVDLKWCYMRQDGSDAACKISGPMSSRYEVTTPNCFRCRYKVIWEVYLTSDRARGEFGSDEAMLRRLRNG